MKTTPRTLFLFAVLVFLGIYLAGGMQGNTDDGRFGDQYEYTKITTNSSSANNYTISGSNMRTYWLAFTSDVGADIIYVKPCGTTATSTNDELRGGETLELDINCTQFSVKAAANTPVVRVRMLKRGYQ